MNRPAMSSTPAVSTRRFVRRPGVSSMDNSGCLISNDSGQEIVYLFVWSKRPVSYRKTHWQNRAEIPTLFPNWSCCKEVGEGPETPKFNDFESEDFAQQSM